MKVALDLFRVMGPHLLVSAGAVRLVIGIQCNIAEKLLTNETPLSGNVPLLHHQGGSGHLCCLLVRGCLMLQDIGCSAARAALNSGVSQAGPDIGPRPRPEEEK